MNYTVASKEKLYLTIMSIVSICLYSAMFVWFTTQFSFIGTCATIVGYGIFIAGFRYILSCLILGYLKGNAIRVYQDQFPQLFSIYKQHCQSLKLDHLPDIYVFQGHGMLNAFAARMARRNVVVLYSGVLEAAYQEGMHAVSFIVGHELGHIVRSHVGGLKTVLTLPASFVPFLGTAYSRACETTCDNIGYALCPEGAVPGLLILTAGVRLAQKVSVHALLARREHNTGFAPWFAEIFSTHPALLKRIEAFYDPRQIDTLLSKTPKKTASYAPPQKQSETQQE